MKLLVPILTLAAIANPVLARTPIIPGYWESTNKVLSPIRQTSVEKRCITAADVDKFMAGPSNRRYTCTYPTRVIADGKIRLKGACVDKKGREISVEGVGAYTPTSFNLAANIAMDFAGLPIQGEASTEAHRIADTCPAPEPLAPPAPPAPAADPAPAPAEAPAPAVTQ